MCNNTIMTKSEARRLGLQYIDLDEEKSKIDTFASNLNTQLAELQVNTPRFTPPPENSSSPGEPISIAADSNYLYVCTQQNLWKRLDLNEL